MFLLKDYFNSSLINTFNIGIKEKEKTNTCTRIIQKFLDDYVVNGKLIL